MPNSISELTSYLQTMGVYQTSTYTYTKSAPTYVLGYRNNDIQILKSTVIYGGIRDLGGYIYGNPLHRDLAVAINPQIGGVNLPGYIKSTLTETLNLRVYIKQVDSTVSDILAQINGILNIGQANLSAYLQAVPPADLLAYLNVISVSNLQASIVGDLFKGSADLGAVVEKIFQSGQGNLSAYIAKRIDTGADLFAQINSISYKDLTAYIYGDAYAQLSAYIYSIASINLPASIHGYDIKDLSALISGGYGPNDLSGYIDTILPSNLLANISGYKGIEITTDLTAIIGGFYTSDLSAVLNVITPSNLPAYLNAVGKTVDLAAFIYPKVIYLKRVLGVSLLENRNLYGIINAHCFNSKAEDLSAYLYPLMKSDLRSNIVGWYGGKADNLLDLNAYINVGDYSVEDTITVTTFPSDKHTQLKVTFSDNSNDIYKTFDTLRIKFGSYFSSDLSTYIYGLPLAKDLSGYVNAIQQAPYKSIPDSVNIKTREIVLNLKRFEPRWRRVAEVFFDDLGDGYPFHYFYVSGEDKVYKVDRSKNWLIRAEGFSRAPANTGMDRQKIVRKYIFNMGMYSNVDEAVRDLVDRVTFLRRTSIAAYINGIMPPHKDLSASMTIKSYYNWVSALTVNIKSIHLNSYSMSASIYPQSTIGSDLLSASITATQPYTPSVGDLADFSFTAGDVGYISPNYNDADYEFNT